MVAAISGILIAFISYLHVNKPSSGNIPVNVPVSSGFDRDPGPVIVENTGPWETYTSVAGGYSIELPGKPLLTSRSVVTSLGATNATIAIVGSRKQGKFLISHEDVPYDTAGVPLDKLLEVSIAIHGGMVLSSRDVTVAGRPGKEFVVEIQNVSPPAKGVFRAVGVGRRVYSLPYISSATAFDEVAVQRSFESFAITGAQAGGGTGTVPHSP
jgi:hypothetical protein